RILTRDNFARSRAAEAHYQTGLGRPVALRLRCRGCLSSHRLRLRSYLTSTASAASRPSIMPTPTNGSTYTIVASGDSSLMIGERSTGRRERDELAKGEVRSVPYRPHSKHSLIVLRKHESQPSDLIGNEPQLRAFILANPPAIRIGFNRQHGPDDLQQWRDIDHDCRWRTNRIGKLIEDRTSHTIHGR